MQNSEHVTSELDWQSEALSAITLRDAGPDDQDFLLKVYADSRKEEMEQATHWDAEEKQRFLAFQFSAQDTYYKEHYPHSDFYVICHLGQDVGRLYLERTADNICIMDIAVLHDFRRRGIGRFLLRQVLEEARQTHKSVSLHVEPDNPAKKLYLAEGFEVTGEISFYQRMEWRQA